MDDIKYTRDSTLILTVPGWRYQDPDFHKGFPEENIREDDHEIAEKGRIFLIHRARYGHPSKHTYRPPYQNFGTPTQPMSKNLKADLAELKKEFEERLKSMEQNAFEELIKYQLGLSMDDIANPRRTAVLYEVEPQNLSQLSEDETNTCNRCDGIMKRMFIAELIAPRAKIRTEPTIDCTTWTPVRDIRNYCAEREAAGIEQALDLYIIDC